MARLTDYRRKRDFERTPEPSGRETTSEPGRGFIIQKHKARRLHYDLRLELDGVLLSWAVPKGPSLDPGERRLAVRVEDHPIEYASFEGVIPEGEYGGGTVMLWDRGSWEPEGDPREGLRQGKLHFRLRGEKLSGGWVLARMGGKRATDKDWLLIKARDEEADPSRDIEAERPESVATGRELDDIADAAEGVWSGAAGRTGKRHSKSGTTEGFEQVRVGGLDGEVVLRVKAKPRGAFKTDEARTRDGDAGHDGMEKTAGAQGHHSPAEREPERERRPLSGQGPAAPGKSPGGRAEADVASRARPGLPDFAALPGARPGPMPAKPQPQLAMLVDAPPVGRDWLHEIKLDGYRLLLLLEAGKPRFMTRGGEDWTHRFPDLARAAIRLPLARAVLDGEAVVIDEQGRSDFQAMQNMLKGLGSGRLVMYLFDMLHAEGVDLTGCGLETRKEALRAVLHAAGPSALRFSEHIAGKGAAVLENACRLGLEGIVSKRADAPYEPRRAPTWLKVKCVQRQEVVIAGWTDPKGTRAGFGALLAGVRDERGRLTYVGKIGTGYDGQTLGELSARLAGLGAEASPFTSTRGIKHPAETHWVRPELVAEVEFAGWTRDGIMRHPSFMGLREDKRPDEVVRETPAKAPGRQPSRSRRGAVRRSPAKSVARVTHPDKLLYPDTGLTKGGLADYYREVAWLMLPHVADRPLSLVRCPDGLEKGCFFQRHPAGALPAGTRGVRVPQGKDGKGERTWLSVADLDGLVGLVQAGVLEIHAWGARNEDLERPDILVLDLDPGEGVEPARTVAAALDLRDTLAGLGLASFVKATGGKGFHVVAPLSRRPGWDELREFARAVSEDLAARRPGEYVTMATKSRRPGRIFIDWLRNARGASSVAPYSTRARPGAPVAAPLEWPELTPDLTPDAFDVQSMLRRVAGLRADPWQGFFDLRQGLMPTMWRQLGRKRPRT